MWSKPGSKHALPETAAKIGASVKRLHDDPNWTVFITERWRACEKRTVSKLETSIKEELKRFGFLHSTERPVKFVGPFIPDYVNFVERTILEVHGDYWHANPCHYDATDLVYFCEQAQRKLTASEIWQKDEERSAFYRERGWNVCVLWESDIKAWRRRNT